MFFLLVKRGLMELTATLYSSIRLEAATTYQGSWPTMRAPIQHVGLKDQHN